MKYLILASLITAFFSVSASAGPKQTQAALRTLGVIQEVGTPKPYIFVRRALGPETQDFFAMGIHMQKVAGSSSYIARNVKAIVGVGEALIMTYTAGVEENTVITKTKIFSADSLVDKSEAVKAAQVIAAIVKEQGNLEIDNTNPNKEIKIYSVKSIECSTAADAHFTTGCEVTK
jgi:hypothetical protein